MMFLFVIAPLVIFASLLALPAGKPALMGCVVAAVVVAVVWRWAGGLESGFGALLGYLYGGPIVLAGLAQVLRLMPVVARARHGYAVTVAALVVATALPLIYLMGA